MIASCWDWPSLKYSYFILENVPLDAGGWSPTKGIVARSKSGGNSVKTLEDVLPTLPKNCFYAGCGDACVGELYEKRDHESRPSLDIQMIKSQGTPQEQKVVELLEGRSNPSVGRLRDNSAKSSQSTGDKLSLYPQERSIWELLIPTATSITAGYFAFKAFQNLSEGDLALRDILFAWGAGVAVGLTIGQEATRQSLIREKDESDV